MERRFRGMLDKTAYRQPQGKEAVTTMLKLRIGQLHQDIIMQPGESIAQALLRKDYKVPMACGGNGTCGKCKVEIDGAWAVSYTHLDVYKRQILDGQGVMLLGRHQILNQEQIENLDKMGYPGLYIDDKFSEEIEIAEVIKPSIHSKILEIVHHLFIDRMEEEDVSEQEWQIREAVMQVVDSLLENEEVMYNMMSLKNYDDYTYFHSVNVGILSAVIGAHYGMDEYELRILTTAALLLSLIHI